MVLSCSLRDFLSPLGMEIRLGLCKRIFYFSFFPPLLFFHVRCPEWPFRKSNLDFFPSLTTAFFSFAICCNTDICPVDFSGGEFWKGPFFQTGRRRKSRFPVTSTLWPPVSRNSTLKWRPNAEHWLPPVTLKWILSTGGLMDFMEKQLWLEVQSVDSIIVWIFISPLSKV